MKRSSLILMAAVGAILVSFAPTAAGAGYIKFDGIDGEFTREGHKGWIEVSSVQFGTPPPAPPPAPAPAGLAAGGPGRLTISKKLDKASPLLQQAAAKGQLVPAVIVEVPKTAPGAQAYLKYELKNVMVSSIRPTGGGAGGSAPMEEITLNFSKIEFKYAEQKPPVRKAPAAVKAP